MYVHLFTCVVFVWVSMYVCTVRECSYTYVRTCCVTAVTCLVWSLCKWFLTSDCHRMLSPVESVITTGEGKVVVRLLGALVRLLL